MAVDLSEYAEPDSAEVGVDLSQYAVPEERPGVQEFDVSGLQQAPTNVRQPGYAPADVAENVANIFTGNDRREFDLPEFDLPFEFSRRQAKTAAGLMATFNPERELQVLKNNYPDLKFAQDRFGNLIADGSAYGGGVGYVNAPGLSVRDLMEVGFQVAAFTPAGRAGQIATTTGARMAAVGGTAAVTEAALDETARGMAGEPTGLEGVNVGNVGVAGVGGAAFEGFGIMLAKALRPKWQAARGEVTDDIRQVFFEEARRAGYDVDQITDDVIKYFMDAAENAVDPANVPAVRDASTFGIRYTKGQAGQRPENLNQLRREERLRTGPSESASNTMNRFADEQGKQIMDARGRMQDDIAGGHPRIDRPAEAGEAILGGVRSRSASALNRIDAAYEDPRIASASLLPEGQRGLTTRMERVIKAGDYVISDETPATKGIIAEVRNLRAFLDDAGNLAKPQKLKRLERLRRRINAAIGTAKNKTDMRQARELKEEFDLYLDRAITRHLFTGDPEALSLLKTARGLHAAYMKKFAPQYRRGRSGARYRVGAGDVVERIIEADPTAENVINYMFGMSKLGGRERGTQILKQFKEVLGESSPEWSAIRQAAFLNLTDPGKATTISGAKFLTKLTDALNNSRSMMDLLFTKQEIQTLNRFARAVSRAQPELFNKSGTAGASAGFIADVWKRVVAMFGYSQGGPAGAVAAERAATTFTGYRDWLRSQQATRPALTPLKRLTGMPAAGAPASVGAFGD